MAQARSHDERPSSVQQAASDGGITINAAIAQERPVAANVFKGTQIYLADQDFFLVMRGLRDNSAKRITQERASPEFKSSARSGVAANVPSFKSHPVNDCDVHPIGDSVGTLNGSPRIVLSCTEL